MRKTVQIEEKIKKELPDFNLARPKIELLGQFLDLLTQWNDKINLTAVRDQNAIIVKLLLDSLVVFHFVELNERHLFDCAKTLDMGSGAGIPGIILGICNSKLNLVSVDKSKKKIAFQNQVIRQLNIDNVKAIQSRLEDFAVETENKSQYDVIISRAFDQIKNILYVGAQFLKPKGYFLLWKGDRWQEELAAVDPQEILNYEVCMAKKYEFKEFNHGGTILLIQKLN
jgi:16S rRNA (guanine527-N7)-methyltransferase